MNPNRKLIVLTPNIVRVSREYGEAMARWYASPEGQTSRSRSRSGEWGAELDPIRQGQGKAGEYAVAVYYGLDPKIAVSRSISRADNGSDVRINNRTAIDVKTTPKKKRWMVWSKELNDLYETKQFDVLVNVSIDPDDWSQCWIEGWVSKAEFFKRKMVANGINDEGKLTLGTWFMRKVDLEPIDMMLAGFVGQDAEGRFVHYCHCGKFGPFGFGYFPKKGETGEWFCREHKPVAK